MDRTGMPGMLFTRKYFRPNSFLGRFLQNFALFIEVPFEGRGGGGEGLVKFWMESLILHPPSWIPTFEKHVNCSNISIFWKEEEIFKSLKCIIFVQKKYASGWTFEFLPCADQKGSAPKLIPKMMPKKRKIRERRLREKRK